MSKTAIVKSGERFFIKQLSKSQPIKLDRVIFANVPGINSNTDVDANEQMPDASQIVHSAPVTQSGLLNDRTVVYSVILDTGVGDFSFNYIGLVNAETNTLCMVMHTDLTKKIKTTGQRQGNTITESIWLEMDNASESTGVTVNAQTWQIDYSKRLAGEDERIRLTNYDLYNRIAINTGLDITQQNNQLVISPGIVYIAGLRVELLEVININVENNQSLYVDAWLTGTITGEWTVKFNLIAGANLHDYHDGNFQHYVERIASIDNEGNLIKVNPKSFVTTFDLASLTKTGIVKLSSAINSESETEAATPLAIKTVNDKINDFGDKFSWSDQCQQSVVMSPDKKYHFVVRNDGVVGVYSCDVKNIIWSFSDENFNSGVISANKINDLDQFVRDRTTPVGVPLPWPQMTPPLGWFECNGSTFNKEDCPKLAAAYPHGFLPDLRGEFIRGWDNGRGADPDRGMLSWQFDAIRNIYGEFVGASNSGYVSGAFAAHGAMNGIMQINNTPWCDRQHYSFDATRIVPTAHENRPRNIAFMYIVKAE